ncbi:methionine-R-sulfoxide reductase B1 isoform X3 [Drosophila persimilis]|uniref:methionine-R-sulfoxide reductase B1 isoform X3 n=1 Tax=Drosophila persimilis TaxID=7234 RepID=UPI000708836B|nr:methionine-R-sulfoxide reductase B1 isoform X3 [Drosophila persimilis]
MFSLSRHALQHTRNFALIAAAAAKWRHPNRNPLGVLAAAVPIARCFADTRHDSDEAKTNPSKANNMENKTEKVTVNKEELRKRLTPLQYQVTQEAGTERPYTGCYNKHYEKGVYQCIVCHQDLFSSDTKYDSGCGWPAFNDVLDKGKVTLHRDASIPVVISKTLGMVRTEVRCSKCSAHMGHVFDDGPPPKHHRFCINSASIDFVKSAPTAASTTTSSKK